MKKPFMGCAYYPEDWAEEQIDYDISMMKKAGITCARIGEFAWRKMEPERGRYDFKWLGQAWRSRDIRCYGYADCYASYLAYP